SATMGTPQLSYSQTPAAGRPGQCADLVPAHAYTKYVAAAMTSGLEPGRLAVRDADGEAIYPAGQALDDDAIIATGASTAGVQDLDIDDFDGVNAGARIAVPAKVTLTLSSHSDWDATNATLAGIDSEGNAVTETLAIPNAGDATVTSTNRYVQVTGLTIPAQS